MGAKKWKDRLFKVDSRMKKYPKATASAARRTGGPAPSPLVSSCAEASSLPRWRSSTPPAGMVIAAFSSPAQALDRNVNAVEPTLGKFTIKSAKFLELCKNNKKYAKKWKDR